MIVEEVVFLREYAGECSEWWNSDSSYRSSGRHCLIFFRGGYFEFMGVPVFVLVFLFIEESCYS